VGKYFDKLFSEKREKNNGQRKSLKAKSYLNSVEYEEFYHLEVGS
jgi:hypothetical protein